uniref:Basal body orientation factor 1 n=1 Tax=Poecilia latipinna TaxID=48699 RepID=A0A3B3VUT3_9TELE
IPTTGKNKSSKHEPKTEKEPDLETARANAALWELKLKITEQDLSDYRGAHHNMVSMNEQLTNQLFRCEQNCVDMTGYWQKEVEDREEKKTRGHRTSRAKQTGWFSTFLLSYNVTSSVLLPYCPFLCPPLLVFPSFTATSLPFLSSLESVRKCSVCIFIAGNKFLSSLFCLIFFFLSHSKMESALTSAFKERDSLNETLKTTIQEAEGLKKLTHSLAKEKLSDTAKMEVKEKKLSEVMAKAASLELALAEISRKSEQQEEKEKRNLVTIQASQVELDKLQKLLAMREKEMQHVKQLAKTIVVKRREVEEFFHEALGHVRQEIVASKLQNEKEALQDYRQKFREATAGMIKFPPIRTVNRSPNYLYADMEAAAQWSHPPSGEVNMSHLTWEQKEKVLSLLFAKMNGQTERIPCSGCYLEIRFYALLFSCNTHACLLYLFGASDGGEVEKTGLPEVCILGEEQTRRYVTWNFFFFFFFLF